MSGKAFALVVGGYLGLAGLARYLGRHIPDALTIALDSLVLLVPRRSTGSVLVIQQGLLGDFVLWLGVARYIREKYPGRRIVLLANPNWAAWACAAPWFDEVIPIPPALCVASLLRRLSVLAKLRRRGFDVALAANRALWAWKFVDSVIRICGAKERVSLSEHGSQPLRQVPKFVQKFIDRWYTHIMDTPRLDQDHFLTIHQQGCAAYWNETSPDIKPWIPDSMIELAAADVVGKKYAVLLVGSGKPYRMWPVARWAAVLERIHRSLGLEIVLCGNGPAEKEIATHITVRLIDVVRIHNLVGQLSLAELTGVLARAGLVLGNETGPIHIATILGRPTVYVLGGGHFGWFAPIPENIMGVTFAVPVYVKMPCFLCNAYYSQAH